MSIFFFHSRILSRILYQDAIALYNSVVCEDFLLSLNLMASVDMRGAFQMTWVYLIFFSLPRWIWEIGGKVISICLSIRYLLSIQTISGCAKFYLVKVMPSVVLHCKLSVFFYIQLFCQLNTVHTQGKEN